MTKINVWEDTYETDDEMSRYHKSLSRTSWRLFLSHYARWYLSSGATTWITIHSPSFSLIDRILYPIWQWLHKRYTMPGLTFADLKNTIDDMMEKKAIPIHGVWYSVEVEEYQGGDK